MGPLALLNHLLNFMLPAAALALLVPALAWVFMRKLPAMAGWWAQVAIQFVAGVGVLVLGLVLTGQDGRMATYAALVGVCTTLQWVLLRGWRG